MITWPGVCPGQWNTSKVVAPSSSVSPSFSQRSGVKLRAPVTPQLAADASICSIQKPSSGCGPSIFRPVRSRSSAAPPQWSRWPWVTQILSSSSPRLATSFTSPAASAPGSMIAAFPVLVHQTSVQFCCSGVTGTTSAPIGGMDAEASAKGAPKGEGGACRGRIKNRNGAGIHNSPLRMAAHRRR